MSVLKLFIVDDEALARERMRTLLSDIASECPTEVVGEADRAQNALDQIVALRPDLVLLDVQMPGISGLEFAQHLLHNLPDDYRPGVIFVTAHDMYALQAFDVHAIDYLLKPVRAQRLQDAILRAMKLREKEIEQPRLEVPPPETNFLGVDKRQFFSVLERGRILLVPVKDVAYLKAEQKYLTLHTRTGHHLLENSLQAIEQEFDQLFVRIHRNTLVARSMIAGVERGMDLDEQTGKMTEAWQVIVKDMPDRLPISRRLWPTVKALVK